MAGPGETKAHFSPFFRHESPYLPSQIFSPLFATKPLPWRGPKEVLPSFRPGGFFSFPFSKRGGRQRFFLRWSFFSLKTFSPNRPPFFPPFSFFSAQRYTFPLFGRRKTFFSSPEKPTGVSGFPLPFFFPGSGETSTNQTPPLVSLGRVSPPFFFPPQTGSHNYDSFLPLLKGEVPLLSPFLFLKGEPLLFYGKELSWTSEGTLSFIFFFFFFKLRRWECFSIPSLKKMDVEVISSPPPPLFPTGFFFLPPYAGFMEGSFPLSNLSLSGV